MNNTITQNNEKIESSFDNGFTLKEMLSIQKEDTRTGMDEYMPKNWYQFENRFFYRNPFGAWPKNYPVGEGKGEYLGQ